MHKFILKIPVINFGINLFILSQLTCHPEPEPLMGASKETVEGSCDEVALLHCVHWE